MKILHVLLTRMPLPPPKYGGTERVLWALYQGQKELGHEVKFFTKSKNSHPDALQFNPNKTLEEQIEGWADVIHFHFLFDNENNTITTPYVCTTHNQQVTPATFPKNTIFLGKLHAQRSGGEAYVHNGLYWDDYGQPNLNMPDKKVHFLANAKYRDKNLADSIDIARTADKNLQIIGGKRYSFKWRKDGKYKPYFYPGSDLTFHGIIGGEKKHEVIKNSQALLFPVVNYEAFGLAIIESLFFGCPVIGSSFGSLPELVIKEVGITTNSKSEMITTLKNIESFNRRVCHEYARDNFNHLVVSCKYIEYYEQVLNGHTLHDYNPSCGTLPLELSLKD